jgi:hypothetical protein
VDEQTKKNLQEFQAIAERRAGEGDDSEWKHIGAGAMKLGIQPPLILRIIYFVWLDLKTRIERLEAK